MDINQAFAKIQENMDHFVSPKIVILTASDFTQSEEELSQPLNLIKEQLLSVDILTMSNAKNSALMPLSVYGQVFAGNLNFYTKKKTWRKNYIFFVFAQKFRSNI